MSEETQKQEAPETPEVVQDQQPAEPEIPTIEQLQAQLAEKEAKLREIGTKAETLEKIVTERQTAPITQAPQPTPVQRQTIDLEKESEKVFETLSENNDPKAAAKQFKEMLQKARQEDIDSLNDQLKIQQKVQAKANDLLSRKPHFERFKDEVYAQVERNVREGFTLDQAFQEAEKIYDVKLAGFAAPKEQPPVNQQPNAQPPPAQARPTQGIAQHMPPKPAEQPVEETYAQYMARRSRSLWDKRTKIRK